MWRKGHHHNKKICEQPILINFKVSVRIILYTLCPIFNIIQNYIPGGHIDIVTHIFRGNIFNVYIRCILLNPEYSMPNLYWTTLECDRDIGPTLCYHKCPIIWSLIFVCGIVSEHEFISNFIVVVNYFILFCRYYLY